jgi:hypothetical protein
MLWVAPAGPMTNLAMGAISALATRIVWLLMEILPVSPVVHRASSFLSMPC